MFRSIFILGLLLTILSACASYQDFMGDDNATLEKYYLEYTMDSDSVKISKYPAYTSEKYKNRRERLIIVDTIFNYQVEKRF